MQQALISANNAAAPLSFERNLTNGITTLTTLIDFVEGHTHRGNLWISEYDAQWHPAQSGPHIRIPSRVIAGYSPLISRLMEQWHLIVGISSDKDMTVTALKRVMIEQR